MAIAWAINRAAVVPSLSVEYQTAESFLNEAAHAGPPAPQYTGVASGTVRSIPMGPFYAALGHGPGREHVTGASATTPAFSLLTWAIPMDLVATMISVADSTREIATGVRAILRRDQQLSPGNTIAVDFSDAEAFPLGSATFSWTGPELGVAVEFISATGSRALLSRVQETVSDKALIARSRVVTRIPTERLVAGDLHEVSFGDGTRRVTRWTHALNDATLDLGPTITPPAVTVASSGPAVRPRFLIPAQVSYGDFASASAEQRGIVPGSAFVGTLRRVSVLVTKGYLGAIPDRWTLEVPDLSNVAGFPSSVLLAPGGFSWTASAFGCNCAQRADSVFDGKVERRWVVTDTVR